MRDELDSSGKTGGGFCPSGYRLDSRVSSEIGWMKRTGRDMVSAMHKLHDIAKPGEGLRPELRSLYERLAKDPYAAQFVRGDGIVQSGPDPVNETSPTGRREPDAVDAKCVDADVDFTRVRTSGSNSA